MFRMRSGEVVGVTKRICERPLASIKVLNRDVSSYGSSGKMIPSTPAFAALAKKSFSPNRRIGFKYPMRTSGMFDLARMPRAVSSTDWSVTPFLIATFELSWIAGPSASGSEKGIPISRISAPPRSSATAISSVESSFGNPAVRKNTIAFFFSSLSVPSLSSMRPTYV